MINNDTVLGIEITSRNINMLWAKQKDEKIKILKSVSEPLPKGIVEKGNVQDVSALSKTISKLKRQHKILPSKTSVGISISPMLIQLMYMPKPIPTNPRKHFEKEVKEYAVLSEDDSVAIDFCRTLCGVRKNDNRLLVVAAEHKKISKVIKTFKKSNIELTALEPALIGNMSSLYPMRIKSAPDKKSLFITFREGLLNLVVFYSGGIDLINTKKPTKEQVSPENLAEYISEQINTIQNYYEIELMEDSDKWQVTITSDHKIDAPEKIEDKIKQNIDCESILFINQYIALTGLSCFESENTKQTVSPVVAGLVMQLLDFDRDEVRINLLPPEMENIKEMKKQSLMTMNFAAVIILVTFLFIGILNSTIKNINIRMNQRSYKNTSKLIQQKEALEANISKLSSLITQSRQTAEKHKNINWYEMLDSIKTHIPSDVRVSNITSRENKEISITGLALSYESVNKFADLLNNNEQIKSAKLSETQKSSQNSQIIEYALSCSLAD
jgi:Tfp pilus assembly PilM family ATPase/Tfp pilus assembly protein PilN